MVKIMAEACANRTHQRQDHYRTTGFEVQCFIAPVPLYYRLIVMSVNHKVQIWCKSDLIIVEYLPSNHPAEL